MTSSHGRTSVGQPAGNYLEPFYTNIKCRLEDPMEATDDRENCDTKSVFLSGGVYQGFI